jgi:hypothetical protein
MSDEVINITFGIGLMFGIICFFCFIGYGCQKQNQRESMTNCFAKIQREECFK